jgi:hypothetical protein
MQNTLLLIGGPGHGQTIPSATWPADFKFPLAGTMNHVRYIRTIWTQWEDGGIDAAWYLYTFDTPELSDRAINELIDQYKLVPIAKATELP